MKEPEAMPVPCDEEKMYKLPAGLRFFDINELWPAGHRRLVRWLSTRPVTANQITLLSLVAGVLSAGCFLAAGYRGLAAGAFFLYAKIYLDNVDGNLARLRGETSRLGRFLDSTTDFTVTVLVYSALTFRLVRETGDAALWFLGLAALLSGLIQCSFFVFYLVSCASLAGAYEKNRGDESLTGEDKAAYKKAPLAYFLQRFHLAAYGWQDRLVAGLDRYSRRLARLPDTPRARRAWYADKRFLTLAGPLCLCTNNMALVVFSLCDAVQAGFIVIAGLANLYMAGLTGWKIARFKFILQKEKPLARSETR